MRRIVFPTGMLGANTYLIWADNTNDCIIIDPGGSFDLIVKNINKHGLIPKHVLLTHGHYDHIGALNDVRRAYDVDVYAHADCSHAIVNIQLNMSAMSAMSMAEIQCEPAENLVSDGAVLSLCGLDITAIHAPGHAKGCMVYVIGDCAFTGDVLFRMSIGRCDLIGSDPSQMEKSLEKLKTRLTPEMHILPGHDDESVFSYELANNPYLNRL